MGDGSRLRKALNYLTNRRLVDSRGVTVEHETIVRRAIDSFAAGTADFSDHVILESSRQASALPVLTFDQRFARDDAHVELVPAKR